VPHYPQVDFWRPISKSAASLKYLHKHHLRDSSDLQNIGVLNAGPCMRLGSVGHATPHSLAARKQASQSQGLIRGGNPVLKSAQFCCVTESYHSGRMLAYHSERIMNEGGDSETWHFQPPNVQRTRFRADSASAHPAKASGSRSHLGLDLLHPCFALV
jgi:hypothetical protein